MTSPATGPPRLEMRGVRKHFPGVQALDGARLRVLPREVHCLLGANGAGKSTLMKVLSGAYRPDDGQILLDGEPVSISSPADGLRAGVSLIYQELDLVPQLTVEQNLLLGRVPQRLGFIRQQERKRLAAAALERIGGHVRLDQRVVELSVSEQQLVAIAKALTFDARVIVMDEPSATLSSHELTKLFSVIRSLAEEGHSVVYITHRLNEVFEVGDRATVMRDGRTVGEYTVAESEEAELVSAMIGRHSDYIERHSRPDRDDQAQPLLAVHRANLPGVIDVQDIRMQPGEILGLAGLAGSGRTTFLRALFGLNAAELDVELHGEPYTPGGPSQAIARGVGLVPENRREEGLILCRPVSENLVLAAMSKYWVMPGRRLTDLAAPLIDKLDIRIGRRQQLAQTLSGGNQQKVVLGKWILRDVDLLLLDEPSRGLDVGAKQSLYEEIRRLANEGRGCLVASSELPELIANCDRVVVFHGGRNIGEFDPSRATTDEVHRAVITGRKVAA